VKNILTRRCRPTIYAVSFVCMLAALPFSHTNATAYTATECGVMLKMKSTHGNA